MAAVTNGAELVRRLRESGTPDHLLAPARSALAADRGADAGAVIAALEAVHGADHGTPRKARAIAETGEPVRPGASEVPIEEQILGPKEDAPAGEPGDPKSAGDDAGRGGPTPAPAGEKPRGADKPKGEKPKGA